MSQRLAERNPKRMLVIYKEDRCTSILNTGKVKRILSGEAKLTEGSTQLKSNSMVWTMKQ
jgi:hypothetical protein